MVVAAGRKTPTRLALIASIGNSQGRLEESRTERDSFQAFSSGEAGREAVSQCSDPAERDDCAGCGGSADCDRGSQEAREFPAPDPRISVEKLARADYTDR